MVFSSIPAYLDPANWQQQLNHQAGVSGIPSAPQPQPPPPPPPPPQHGGPGTIRPGSLADRARLANIPMPEAAMKCPRCESTNTKFCYFNNYSLSQPRHFCKTCRRYWTRGGALRNVPVGGGCRRNKRSSSKGGSGGGGSSSSNGNGNGNASKSPSTSSERASISGCSSSAVSASSFMPGNFAPGAHLSPQIPPLRFMSPLGQLSEHYGHGNENLGLNMNYNGFSGFSAMAPARENFNFQFGNNNNNNNNILGGGGGGGGLASLLSGGIEQWRVQTPMMGGLDLSQPGWIGPEAGPFGGGETSEIRPNKFASSSLLTTQMASVKMEDHNNNNQESSMAARQFMGFQSPAGNEQWGGGGGGSAAATTATAWSNVSASFSSSSTSNQL